MFRVFKITHAGHQTTSPDLLGLLFIETDAGFFLVDPESEDINKPPRIMPHAVLRPKNPPAAEFKFCLSKLDWTVTVDHPTSISRLHGTWRNGAQAEEDHWVATGTGNGEPDDDEARAASATN